jgi:hypothetical protein
MHLAHSDGSRRSQLREQDGSADRIGAVSTVAQREVDRALRTCQDCALRLLRRKQKRNHSRIQDLAGWIGLRLVPRRDDHGILQDCRRQGLRSSVRAVGHQDIEMRTGHEKSGNTDDLVGPQRDGAHAVWNPAGKANTRARRCEVAVEDRLALGERKEDLSPGHVGSAREGSVDGYRSGPRDEFGVRVVKNFARL